MRGSAAFVSLTVTMVLTVGVVLLARHEPPPSEIEPFVRRPLPEQGTPRGPESPFRYPILDMTPRRAGYLDTLRSRPQPPVPQVRVEPKPTAESLRTRTFGIVVLEVIVEPDGAVSGARVVKPLSCGLTEAAIEAAKRWKFQPAMEQGRAVRGAYQLTMSFDPPNDVQ